jgi:hypothetical protein
MGFCSEDGTTLSFPARAGASVNHKPKQGTKGEVQTLIKMINGSSAGGKVATKVGKYLASLKVWTETWVFCSETRGAVHRDLDV